MMSDAHVGSKKKHLEWGSLHVDTEQALYTLIRATASLCRSTIKHTIL